MGPASVQHTSHQTGCHQPTGDLPHVYIYVCMCVESTCVWRYGLFPTGLLCDNVIVGAARHSSAAAASTGDRDLPCTQRALLTVFWSVCMYLCVKLYGRLYIHTYMYLSTVQMRLFVKSPSTVQREGYCCSGLSYISS